MNHAPTTSEKYLHSSLVSQQGFLEKTDGKAQRRNSFVHLGPTFDLFANESLANDAPQCHEALFSRRPSIGSETYALPSPRRVSMQGDECQASYALPNSRRLSIGIDNSCDTSFAVPNSRRPSIGGDTSFALPSSRRLSIGHGTFALPNARRPSIGGDTSFALPSSRRSSIGHDTFAFPSSRRLSIGGDTSFALPSSRRSSIGHDTFAFPDSRRPSIGGDTSFALPSSRRLSIGYDNYVLSDVERDGKLNLDQLKYDHEYMGDPKTKVESLGTGTKDTTVYPMRRRGSLDFLRYLFDKDSSTEKDNSLDEDISDSDSVLDETFLLEIEKIVSKKPKEKQIDPSAFRLQMESVDGAMKKSQLSQNSLHEWDKKMGLKRSHSKTMRLSAQSRKKLRACFRLQLSQKRNTRALC